MNTIQKNLRVWFLEHPETNARELSVKAGLNPSMVSDLLNGRSKRPRIDSLNKLASVMNVTSGWLASGPHTTAPKPGMFFQATTGLNEAVFKDVLTMTLVFLEENDFHPAPTEVSEIVFAVYDLIDKGTEEEAVAQLSRLNLNDYRPFITRMIAK